MPPKNQFIFDSSNHCPVRNSQIILLKKAQKSSTYEVKINTFYAANLNSSCRFSNHPLLSLFLFSDVIDSMSYALGEELKTEAIRELLKIKAIR